jgi:hypothetical protein
MVIGGNGRYKNMVMEHTLLKNTARITGLLAANSRKWDAIFGALIARQCYGTTGTRMILDFQADKHPMGSVLSNQSPPVEFQANMIGSTPLESLQLFQGKEIIEEVRPTALRR